MRSMLYEYTSMRSMPYQSIAEILTTAISRTRHQASEETSRCQSANRLEPLSGNLDFPGFKIDTREDLSVANLYKLQSELLNDGRITFDEVNKIRDYIEQDGQLDYDDVCFLVQLVADAKEVCHEFDALFFPAMREILLADGKIGMDEQYQLLRMLYADGKVRPSEQRFLRDLRDSLDEVTPEFAELCETALACPVSDWDVGGRPREADQA